VADFMRIALTVLAARRTGDRRYCSMTPGAARVRRAIH
jgi:hypothetical protein